MARTCRVELDRRQLALLACIQTSADSGTRIARLAITDIQKALGISRSRVRLTLNHALADGLVIKQERFLPNGGQLENAYALTPKGCDLLRKSLIEQEMEFDHA